MRHRIYTPEPFAPGDRIAIRGDELHHAARVVRVREGEEVDAKAFKALIRAAVALNTSG
jgi:hypothetical protein